MCVPSTRSDLREKTSPANMTWTDHPRASPARMCQLSFIIIKVPFGTLPQLATPAIRRGGGHGLQARSWHEKEEEKGKQTRKEKKFRRCDVAAKATDGRRRDVAMRDVLASQAVQSGSKRAPSSACGRCAITKAIRVASAHI